MRRVWLAVLPVFSSLPLEVSGQIHGPEETIPGAPPRAGGDGPFDRLLDAGALLGDVRRIVRDAKDRENFEIVQPGRPTPDY